MSNKETNQNTKISPLIFAVLLIIILLMFAIGKRVDKNKNIENKPEQTTTTAQIYQDSEEEIEKLEEESIE